MTAGFAGLVAIGPASAQTGKFYERIKGHVYEINANAAQGLTPDHWELYLFKRGTTPSPDPGAPGHWGSGTDKDLDKLMESNRKAIAFDHRFERWCGCDGGDLVNDNYFGPIAIMEDENSNQNSAANRILSTISQWKDKIDALKEKVDQAQDLWNFLLSATGARSAEQQLDDLQEKVKLLDPSGVKGYVQNLKLGLSGYAGLQAVLDGAGAQAGNVALLLDNTAQELDAAQASGLKIKQALNVGANPYSYGIQWHDSGWLVVQRVVLDNQLKIEEAHQFEDTSVQSSYSYVASPSMTNFGSQYFAQFTQTWNLEIKCDSNSECIGQSHTEDGTTSNHNVAKVTLRFLSQADANTFTAKFNAQKAILSNAQRQQTAPALQASPALSNPSRTLRLINPTSPEDRRMLEDMEWRNFIRGRGLGLDAPKP